VRAAVGCDIKQLPHCRIFRRRQCLLIDAFDALDQEYSRELYEQLNANRPTRHDNAREIASRYGLRKIFKE
jgi:hypothetical protein